MAGAQEDKQKHTEPLKLRFGGHTLTLPSRSTGLKPRGRGSTSPPFEWKELQSNMEKEMGIRRSEGVGPMIQSYNHMV